MLINYSRGQSESELIVEVRVDGTIVDEFSLHENITKEYSTKYGSNTLIIEDGKIYISSSDCNDQICVDTKAGSLNGDAIVCVPNRFTVEVIGDKGGDVDAIAQ